jgi:hypothetical protein
MGVVLSSGRSKIHSSRGNFQSYTRDFRSMRKVRSYVPNKPVLWPTCSHGERCMMQVYEGWGNYGRRFWHCPLARVRYGNDIFSTTMLGLLTFFGYFSVLRR